MSDQRISVGGTPTRCPYCRDELQAGDEELVACADCGARQHASCHEQHGCCAACTSTRTLYLPGAAPERPRQAPPAGSKIQVRVEGDTTTYSWPAPKHGLLAHILGVLFILVIPPLWLLVILKLLRETPEVKALRTSDTRSIRVNSWGLEWAVHDGLHMRLRHLQRDRLGEPKVIYTGEHGQAELVVDEGVTRHALARPTGLSPAELEWLASQLAAWRAGARPGPRPAPRPDPKQ